MLTYNGKVVKTSGGLWVTSAQQPVDPYNPLGLPQYTIRARFSGTPAATSGGGFSGTITHVSDDVYDIQTSTWTRLFGSPTIGFAYSQINKKPVEVLGANSSGVTNMSYAFYGCTSLSSIPLMDTSSATNMQYTFYGCTSLSSVPSFDTSHVTKMSYMFRGCTALSTAPALSTGLVTEFNYMFTSCTSLTSVPQYNMTSATNVKYMFDGCSSVSSGALTLYTSVSQQTTPPTSHESMFLNCGVNTTNGLAELNQIPGDWGGLYGRITCEKYYYSSANTDLAAYTPRATTGYLAGALWIPDNNQSYANGQVYTITTPATAGTMRIYPTSQFYQWDTSTTQSSQNQVLFGAFAVPKDALSRQAVYSNYYGWASSSEPVLLSMLGVAGTAPSSGYTTYTPPVSTTFNVGIDGEPYPSIPSNWAVLLCLYIYTNNTYYFGTVSRNDYGYLPYTSNDDLIVQVSNLTPYT